MKRANNQGPTDAFSSGAFLEVLATLPRWVMFLLCFSLAIRIRCLATMFAAPHLPRPPRPRSLAAARALAARLPLAAPPDEALLGRAAGLGRARGGADAGRRAHRPSEAGAREDDAGRRDRLAPPPERGGKRKETQRNKRSLQPVGSNCFGFGCQRQHWGAPPRGSAGSACRGGAGAGPQPAHVLRPVSPQPRVRAGAPGPPRPPDGSERARGG